MDTEITVPRLSARCTERCTIVNTCVDRGLSALPSAWLDTSLQQDAFLVVAAAADEPD